LYSRFYDDLEAETKVLPAAVTKGISRDDLGFLCCDGLRVKDIYDMNTEKQFMLTSKSSIIKNSQLIKISTSNLDDKSFVTYDFSSNYNPEVLSTLKDEKYGIVAKNADQMMESIHTGFSSDMIILKGDDTKKREYNIALNRNCKVQISTIEELKALIDSSNETGKIAQVILSAHHISVWNNDKENPMFKEF